MSLLWLMTPTSARDDYAVYVEMNNRFHALLIEGSGNLALARVMDLLTGQPFAGPSALLPMQSSMDEGPLWMRRAHHQHHCIVQAIERGQGSRAEALAQEHVEIARMNLEYAIERPEKAADVMPGIKLVAGQSVL